VHKVDTSALSSPIAGMNPRYERRVVLFMAGLAAAAGRVETVELTLVWLELELRNEHLRRVVWGGRRRRE
jgi:hypothetical protein